MSNAIEALLHDSGSFSRRHLDDFHVYITSNVQPLVELTAKQSASKSARDKAQQVAALLVKTANRCIRSFSEVKSWDESAILLHECISETLDLLKGLERHQHVSFGELALPKLRYNVVLKCVEMQKFSEGLHHAERLLSGLAGEPGVSHMKMSLPSPSCTVDNAKLIAGSAINRMVCWIECGRPLEYVHKMIFDECLPWVRFLDSKDPELAARYFDNLSKVLARAAARLEASTAMDTETESAVMIETELRLASLELTSRKMDIEQFSAYAIKLSMLIEKRLGGPFPVDISRNIMAGLTKIFCDTVLPRNILSGVICKGLLKWIEYSSSRFAQISEFLTRIDSSLDDLKVEMDVLLRPLARACSSTLIITSTKNLEIEANKVLQAILKSLEEFSSLFCSTKAASLAANSPPAQAFIVSAFGVLLRLSPWYTSRAPMKPDDTVILERILCESASIAKEVASSLCEKEVSKSPKTSPVSTTLFQALLKLHVEALHGAARLCSQGPDPSLADLERGLQHLHTAEGVTDSNPDTFQDTRAIATLYYNIGVLLYNARQYGTAADALQSSCRLGSRGKAKPVLLHQVLSGDVTDEDAVSTQSSNLSRRYNLLSSCLLKLDRPEDSLIAIRRAVLESREEVTISVTLELSVKAHLLILRTSKSGASDPYLLKTIQDVVPPLPTSRVGALLEEQFRLYHSLDQTTSSYKIQIAILDTLCEHYDEDALFLQRGRALTEKAFLLRSCPEVDKKEPHDLAFTAVNLLKNEVCRTPSSEAKHELACALAVQGILYRELDSDNENAAKSFQLAINQWHAVNLDGDSLISSLYQCQRMADYLRYIADIALFLDISSLHTQALNLLGCLEKGSALSAGLASTEARLAQSMLLDGYVSKAGVHLKAAEDNIDGVKDSLDFARIEAIKSFHSVEVGNPTQGITSLRSLSTELDKHLGGKQPSREETLVLAFCKWTEARCLMNQGKIDHALLEAVSALRICCHLLPSERSPSLSGGKMNFLIAYYQSVLQSASLHELRGCLREAEYLYQQALRLLEPRHTPNISGELFLRFANIEYLREDFSKCMFFLDKAQALLTGRAGWQTAQRCLLAVRMRQGDLWRRQRKWKDASNCYDEAESIAKELATEDYVTKSQRCAQELRDLSLTPREKSLAPAMFYADKPANTKKTKKMPATRAPPPGASSDVLRSSIQLQSLMARILIRRGRVCRLCGDLTAAKLLLERAIECNAYDLDKATALYHLGCVLLDSEEAKTMIDVLWDVTAAPPVEDTKGPKKKGRQRQKQGGGDVSSSVVVKARDNLLDAYRLSSSYSVPKLQRRVCHALVQAFGRENELASAYFLCRSMGSTLSHQAVSALLELNRSGGSANSTAAPDSIKSSDEEVVDPISELSSTLSSLSIITIGSSPKSDMKDPNRPSSSHLNQSAALFDAFEQRDFAALSFQEHLSAHKTLIDSLPPSWTICAISTSPDLQHLFLCRLSAQQQTSPSVVRIPLVDSLSSSSDDEDDDLVEIVDRFATIMKEFETILQESTETAAGNTATTTTGSSSSSSSSSPSSAVVAPAVSLSTEQKSSWWTKRSALDVRLACCLQNLEDSWIGHWKGLLLGRLSDETLLESIEDLLSTLVTKIAGKKSERPLDRALLECCLSALSHMSTEQLRSALETALGDRCNDEVEELVKTEHARIFNTATSSSSSSNSGKGARKSERNKKKKGSETTAKTDADAPPPPPPTTTSSSVQRGPVILLLDGHLQKIPWESIPILRKQRVTRIPSLAVLQSLLLHGPLDLPPKPSVSYVLDPGGDLTSTRETLLPIFNSQRDWNGIVGRPPNADDIKRMILENDVFIYCGHGSGNQFIRSDDVIKQIGQRCAVVLLMGCSSAALTDVGTIEPTGMATSYLLAGSRSVVGTLWDVTDKDIDRFSVTLLNSWLLNEVKLPLAASVPLSRDACKLRYLVGAAPVIYGLPF